MGVSHSDAVVAAAPGTSTSNGPAASGSTREALIFVAGGGEDWTEQSVHAVGSRIALELDRHTEPAKATFKLSDSAEETYYAGLKTTVATISRIEGSGAVPVLDVYQLETAQPLVEDYARRNTAVKAVFPLMILVSQVVPRLLRWPARTAIRAVKRGEKDRQSGRPTAIKDQLQFVFAGATGLLLTFYVATLIWAMIETADPTLIKGVSAKVPQWIVLVASAVGLTTGIVKVLTQSAVDQLCMILYLSDGYRRDVLRGRVSALVEHVCQKDGVEYSRVVLAGYSFGTIVALDTLFPFDEPPSPHLGRIEALVTIGCPFDIVRTYWPTYFTERTRLDGVPAAWVNIYCPIDVLGSNFRNDSERLGADHGVQFRGEGDDNASAKPSVNVPYASGIPISWRHALTMNGLRAHGLYWETQDDGEVSAFASVVNRVYAGKPVPSNVE